MIGIGFGKLTRLLMQRHRVGIRSWLDDHGVTPPCVYGIRPWLETSGELRPGDNIKIGNTQSLHRRIRIYEQIGLHTRTEFVIWSDPDYADQRALMFDLEEHIHGLFRKYKVYPNNTYAKELFSIPQSDVICIIKENLEELSRHPGVISVDLFEDDQCTESFKYRDEVVTHNRSASMFEQWFD